jgi:hypothetical protein
MMKKIVLLTAAALALLSVAANAQTCYGKGKAPPPPVLPKAEQAIKGPAIVPILYLFGAYEARRIAANLAKLPEPLCKAK